MVVLRELAKVVLIWIKSSLYRVDRNLRGITGPREVPREVGLPAAGRKAGRSVGEMEVADWSNR